MPYPIGRGVTVEVEATTAATKNISAITQASPGVATSTAHGLTNGTIAYLTSVEGMVQLEGQAISVDAPATDTFALENISTAAFPAFSGTTVCTPIATWSTLGNATSVSVGGGDSADVDQTTLIDDLQQVSAGLLAAQTVTIGGFSNFQSAAMLAIQNAAFAQTPLVFRVTLKDGQRRIFRGVPSLPNEDLQVGQTATGQFGVKVTGRVVFLPAA